MAAWRGIVLAAVATSLWLCGPAAAQQVRQFALINQDGQAVTEASYAGRVRVMTFGYTWCPDICPTTLATIAAALDAVGTHAAEVVAIFVSVDPRRDTPQHLKDYVAAFHPRMVGLTGDDRAVAAAARAFNVRYAAQPAPAGDAMAYSVDHSAGIYVIDRKGRLAARIGHRESADDVAARIAAVVDKGE